MSWLDFIVLTLAAGAIVNVWFNGSIFAEWRTFVSVMADEPEIPEEATDDLQGDPPPLLMRVAGKCLPRIVFELFTCDFCLSHHTPWVLMLLFFFPALLVETEWLAFLLKLPVYSLAATQLGNLINAISPASVRYTDD